MYANFTISGGFTGLVLLLLLVVLVPSSFLSVLQQELLLALLELELTKVEADAMIMNFLIKLQNGKEVEIEITSSNHMIEKYNRVTNY